MRIIHLYEIEKFLKHTLKSKLQTDLRNLRILKEGDVECSTYYHLRKILKADPDWRVFARKFSTKTRFYTDLVIFHHRKARIAIEIKWRKKSIPEKDRRALASARKILGVKKTYFYCVMPDASSYKNCLQKERLKNIDCSNGLLTSATRASRISKSFSGSEKNSECNRLKPHGPSLRMRTAGST